MSLKLFSWFKCALLGLVLFSSPLYAGRVPETKKPISVANKDFHTVSVTEVDYVSDKVKTKQVIDQTLDITAPAPSLINSTLLSQFVFLANEELTEAGYTVDSEKEKSRFKITGVITSGEFKKFMPEGRNCIRCLMTIKWQLFDNLQKKNLVEFTVRSYGISPGQGNDGILICFRNGVKNLLAEKGLIEALEKASATVYKNANQFPLHLAVRSGEPAVIITAIKSSPDQINAVDVYNKTPLDVALQLLTSGEKITIVQAVKNAGGKTFKELEQIKLAAEKEEEAQKTVLAKEAELRKEAELKAVYPSQYPLHQAVLDYNKPAILKLIASSGVSINTFDCYENTPCDVATKLPDPGKGLEIFNLLKNAGGSTAAEVKQFAALKSPADLAKPLWEYNTVFFTDTELLLKPFDQRVNELGEEGWEMISNRRAKGTYDWGVEASLKRKKSH